MADTATICRKVTMTRKYFKKYFFYIFFFSILNYMFLTLYKADYLAVIYKVLEYNLSLIYLY